MDMDSLSQIPTPSQLDDWELYNRIIGHEIWRQEGQDRYSSWRGWQQGLEKEREKKLAENQIQEDLELFKLSPKTKAVAE